MDKASLPYARGKRGEPWGNEDMEITELQIPRGFTILGVVNKQEEFIGIVYV